MKNGRYELYSTCRPIQVLNCHVCNRPNAPIIPPSKNRIQRNSSTDFSRRRPPGKANGGALCCALHGTQPPPRSCSKCIQPRSNVSMLLCRGGKQMHLIQYKWNYHDLHSLDWNTQVEEPLETAFIAENTTDTADTSEFSLSRYKKQSWKYFTLSHVSESAAAWTKSRLNRRNCWLEIDLKSWKVVFKQKENFDIQKKKKEKKTSPIFLSH